MHDIGNVEAWRDEKKVRGGGYWGVPSEQTRDLAAWADFAERLGFKRIILVGHSDGWPAVRRYQWQTHDSRVVGLVLALAQWMLTSRCQMQTSLHKREKWSPMDSRRIS